MHQADGLKESLKGIAAAYVRRGLDPTMKPNAAAKVPTLRQNRSKLNAKGHPLTGRLEQVNRTFRKWTSCWHTLTPPNVRGEARRRKGVQHATDAPSRRRLHYAR
jgi:hypothetical protein